MAFNTKDLALALVVKNNPDGQWEGMIGARSCGGTQNDCPNIPFDHLPNGKKDLKALKEELQRTIKAIDKKL